MPIDEEQFAEFLDWYKAVNTPAVRETLEETLDSTKKRIVYKLTDQDRSSPDIEEATDELGHRVPASTVRVWQQRWVKQGLMKRISARKKEPVFSLPDFGIDIGADLSELDLDDS